MLGSQICILILICKNLSRNCSNITEKILYKPCIVMKGIHIFPFLVRIRAWFFNDSILIKMFSTLNMRAIRTCWILIGYVQITTLVLLVGFSLLSGFTCLLKNGIHCIFLQSNPASTGASRSRWYKILKTSFVGLNHIYWKWYFWSYNCVISISL